MTDATLFHLPSSIGPAIVRGATDAFSAADTYILDIWASFKDTVKAWKREHWEGVFDGGARHITAYTSLAYYIMLGFRLLDQGAALLKDKLPTIPWAHASTFLLSISVVSFVWNGFLALQEAVGVTRQTIFMFKDLDAINQLTQDELINRLGESYVEQMDVQAGQIEEENLSELKRQAFKKDVFHILGLVSATLFILSTLGAFVAMPPALPALLLAAGLALWIGRYFVKKKWVDSIPSPDVAKPSSASA
jgi:hypothetical protein